MAEVSLYEYQNDPSDVDVSDFLDHLEILENKRKKEDELRAKKLEAELSRMKTMSRSYNRGYEKYGSNSNDIEYDSDQENKYNSSYMKKKLPKTKKILYDDNDSYSTIGEDEFDSYKPKHASPKSISPRYRKIKDDNYDLYKMKDKLYNSYNIKDKKYDSYKIKEEGSDSFHDYDSDEMERRSQSEFDRKLSVRAKKYLANDEIDDLEDDDIDDIIRLISPIARKLSKAKSSSRSGSLSPLRNKDRRSKQIVEDDFARSSRSRRLPIGEDPNYSSHRLSRSRRRDEFDVSEFLPSKSSRSRRNQPKLPTVEASDEDSENEFYATARSNQRGNNSRAARDSEEPDYLKYKSAYNWEKSLNSKPVYLKEEELSDDGDSLLSSTKTSTLSSTSSYRSGPSPVRDVEFSDHEYSKQTRSNTKRPTIFDNLGDNDDDDSSRDEGKPQKGFSPSLFDIQDLEDEPAIFSLSQPNSLAAKLKQHTDKKQYLNKSDGTDEMAKSFPSSNDLFKPAPNISSSTMTLLRRLSERQSMSSSISNNEQFDVSKYDKHNDLNTLSSFLRSKSIKNKPQPASYDDHETTILNSLKEEEEEHDNDEQYSPRQNNLSVKQNSYSPPKNKTLERLMSLSSAKTTKPNDLSKSPLQERRSRFDSALRTTESKSRESPKPRELNQRSASPVRDLINKHNTGVQTQASSSPARLPKITSGKSISNLASRFESQVADNVTNDISTRSTSPMRSRSPTRTPSPTRTDMKSRFGTINKTANRYAPMPKAEEAISAGLAAKAPAMKRAVSSLGTQKSNGNRYIPVPDSVAAMSAAMAAKAPALHTQVSSTVGERDFSLTDNSKMIKPSYGKREEGVSRRPELDFEREIDLKSDNNLKIKVKEHHWLGSAISRTPTKNKQELLDMINEKPKFYQSIENQRKLHEATGIIEEQEEEEPVDYRSVALKKVAAPVESPLRKDKLFDEIPDFVKLRNKKQAATKKQMEVETVKKAAKAQEEAELLEFKNKLSASTERRNKFEALSNKNINDMPSDSMEIINKIRSKSPERLTQFEKLQKNASKFRDVPEDSEQIINKIRLRSPERINQFEKGKIANFRDMPEDASEIINKIRSKSPQRISEFEKNKRNKFDNVPEDAMEIIKRIRKQN